MAPKIEKTYPIGNPNYIFNNSEEQFDNVELEGIPNVDFEPGNPRVENDTEEVNNSTETNQLENRGVEVTLPNFREQAERLYNTIRLQQNPTVNQNQYDWLVHFGYPVNDLNLTVVEPERHWGAARNYQDSEETHNNSYFNALGAGTLAEQVQRALNQVRTSNELRRTEAAPTNAVEMMHYFSIMLLSLALMYLASN